MQLLVFLDWFEREKGENALPLGVLVDNNVLHPTVWRTAVVLRRKLVRERGILDRVQTKNRVNWKLFR